MSCNYCNSKYFKQLNPDTVEYSGIEVCIDDEGTLRVRHYDSDDNEKTFTTQEIINVNFCPMCGKEFRRDRVC